VLTDESICAPTADPSAEHSSIHQPTSTSTKGCPLGNGDENWRDNGQTTRGRLAYLLQPQCEGRFGPSPRPSRPSPCPAVGECFPGLRGADSVCSNAYETVPTHVYGNPPGAGDEKRPDDDQAGVRLTCLPQPPCQGRSEVHPLPQPRRLSPPSADGEKRSPALGGENVGAPTSEQPTIQLSALQATPTPIRGAQPGHSGEKPPDDRPARGRLAYLLEPPGKGLSDAPPPSRPPPRWAVEEERSPATLAAESFWAPAPEHSAIERSAHRAPTQIGGTWPGNAGRHFPPFTPLHARLGQATSEWKECPLPDARPARLPPSTARSGFPRICFRGMSEEPSQPAGNNPRPKASLPMPRPQPALGNVGWVSSLVRSLGSRVLSIAHLLELVVTTPADFYFYADHGTSRSTRLQDDGGPARVATTGERNDHDSVRGGHPHTGVARWPVDDPWSSWHSARSQQLMTNARPQAARDSFADSFFGLSREEYVQRHIAVRLQDQVRRLCMSDAEVLSLGQRHFTDQAEYLRKIDLERTAVLGPSLVTLGRSHGTIGSNTCSSNNTQEGFGVHDDRGILCDGGEHFEEGPCWWQGDVEALCFDLSMTPITEVTQCAPQATQWWDMEKLAESDGFLALSKPSGLLVTSNVKGLLEASPTNFVHIAHQRFPQLNGGGSGGEQPRQRGLCNRPNDVHMSGIQIFAKSSEALRHFLVEHGAYRVTKECLALVDGRLGEPRPGVGVIDVPMRRWQDPSRRALGGVVCARDGLPAVTKYRVLRQWKVPALGPMRFWDRHRWFTLVQLRILSDRTHQVRAHMAFAGHPVVGDPKYNQTRLEEDAAITPRMFLHCQRMEFEDIGGRPFMACLDLAPDLQAVLCRVHALANGDLAKKLESSLGELGGLPGLERILALPTNAAPEEVPTLMDAEAAVTVPCKTVIQHQCSCCREIEVAKCTVVRQNPGCDAALLWSLSRSPPTADTDDPGESVPSAMAHGRAEFTARETDEVDWGPGRLWLPAELQHRPVDTEFLAGNLQDATAEELGSAWADAGTKWAWAHDGTRQNGWFHLCRGGGVLSKWGAGTWRLLDICQLTPPLLVVTFNAVEHLLRLVGARTEAASFEIISKRRLTIENCVAEGEIESGAPPCCPTRGWPDPHPAVTR